MLAAPLQSSQGLGFRVSGFRVLTDRSWDKREARKVWCGENAG